MLKTNRNTIPTLHSFYLQLLDRSFLHGLPNDLLSSRNRYFFIIIVFFLIIISKIFEPKEKCLDTEPPAQNHNDIIRLLVAFYESYQFSCIDIELVLLLCPAIMEIYSRAQLQRVKGFATPTVCSSVKVSGLKISRLKIRQNCIHIYTYKKLLFASPFI